MYYAKAFFVNASTGWICEGTPLKTTQLNNADALPNFFAECAREYGPEIGVIATALRKDAPDAARVVDVEGRLFSQRADYPDRHPKQGFQRVVAVFVVAALGMSAPESKDFTAAVLDPADAPKKAPAAKTPAAKTPAKAAPVADVQKPIATARDVARLPQVDPTKMDPVVAFKLLVDKIKSADEAAHRAKLANDVSGLQRERAKLEELVNEALPLEAEIAKLGRAAEIEAQVRSLTKRAAPATPASAKKTVAKKTVAKRAR